MDVYGRKHIKVKPYDGSNEIINRLLDLDPLPDDMRLWTVTGPNGRQPVTAASEADAAEIYANGERSWKILN